MSAGWVIALLVMAGVFVGGAVLIEWRDRR